MVYEDLDVERFIVKKPDGTETLHYMTKAEAAKANLTKTEDGQGNNDVQSESLVDWLTMNYTKCGCTLELVSNKSQEGSQFVKGFGGIGGLLRYKMDLMSLRELEKAGLKAEADANDFEDDFM